MKFVKFCMILFLCNASMMEVGLKEEMVFKKKVEVEKKDTMNYFLFENRKIPIVAGTGKDVLDFNVIGIMETFDHFNEEKTTILAAHNDTVFDFLEGIELGTIIQIEGSVLKSYEIYEKHIIKEDDMSYFRQGTEERLVLLTCYGYKKRLVVVANPL